jgi:hypothetical protein
MMNAPPAKTAVIVKPSSAITSNISIAASYKIRYSII